MATPYQVIYDKFLGKITDYSFLSLTDDQLRAICKGFLLGAIPKFKDCKKNLSIRDDVASQFSNDLTDEETEILGSLMVVEWLSPQISSTLIIKQAIGEKDFKMTSQAAHLEKLLELRKEMMNEAEGLIMSYTFDKEVLEEMNRS